MPVLSTRAGEVAALYSSAQDDDANDSAKNSSNSATQVRSRFKVKDTRGFYTEVYRAVDAGGRMLVLVGGRAAPQARGLLPRVAPCDHTAFVVAQLRDLPRTSVNRDANFYLLWAIAPDGQIHTLEACRQRNLRTRIFTCVLGV